MKLLFNCAIYLIVPSTWQVAKVTSFNILKDTLSTVNAKNITLIAGNLAKGIE
jgi:hypothetical protein